MTNKQTLGGVDCSPRCAVFADQCKKCEHQALYINDQRVYDGCKCLKPQWTKGQAIIVDTAKIVDALGVQFDEPEAPTQAVTPHPKA
jgi:hypothetical protein